MRSVRLQPDLTYSILGSWRLAADAALINDFDVHARDNSRTVYSTGAGRTCPRCGWPARDCKCSRPAEEAVPARPVAKLRIEKKARGGKTVTVVDGLPRNSAFLRDLSQELKRACGAGGSVFETGVEVQGDMRERVRAILLEKGFIVKGG